MPAHREHRSVDHASGAAAAATKSKLGAGLANLHAIGSVQMRLVCHYPDAPWLQNWCCIQFLNGKTIQNQSCWFFERLLILWAVVDSFSFNAFFSAIVRSLASGDIPQDALMLRCFEWQSARISFADGHTWQNGFFNGWDSTTVGVLASFTVKVRDWTQVCENVMSPL